MRALSLIWLSAAAFPALLRANPPTSDVVRRYIRDYRAGEVAAAHAGIPSFSRQTGLACSACHTAFPQLTPFGRLFKLNGYTLTALQTVETGDTARQPLRLNLIPPVSAMIQASFTSTGQAVPGTRNGNVLFPQELSIFVGEAITPSIGTFLQLTYEPASGAVALDNADVRFSDHTTIASRSVIYGATLNNNPTVQDVWNTVPAWGYPFASSNVAPTAAGATLIDGGLAQQVAGLGAYALFSDLLYGEFSLYRSAPQGAVNPPDSTSENIVRGVAPYWRLAAQHRWGSNYFELGTYGLSAELFPAGISGPTNRYTDLALDAQYERPAGNGSVVAHATWIHERQQLDAAFAGGEAANAVNTLRTFKLDASYLAPLARYGATVAVFQTSGDADSLLYAPAPVSGSANGRPDTRGAMVELHFMPWLNTRFSAQYVAYDRFNGAGNNYDGSRRNASDNNTLYVLAWLIF